VKFASNTITALAIGFLCSGCLRLEHNTTSPGARGVVLDAKTHLPLSGAQVVVSTTVSNSLAHTRPPLVTTGTNGWFCIPAERHWNLIVDYMTERYRAPGGTLIIQRAGYVPATVSLWGDIIPLSAQRTNFIDVLLSPIAK